MAFTARTEVYGDAASIVSPFQVTVNNPASTANGDIQFTVILTNAGTVTTNAAWSLLASNVANADKYYLFYRKWATGDPTSYTWTLSASTRYRIISACYTAGNFSVASSADITVSSTQYRTSNTTARAASMVVPFPNSPLLFFGANYATAGVRTFTKPSVPTSGWVEDDDAGNAASDFSLEICSYIWTGSGATGDMDATISATSTTKHAFAVALRPNAFSLPAASGSYAVAGTAVVLKAGRILTAASGSYAIAGTAVVLTRGYKIAADAVAYAIAGTAVALKATRRLAADSTAFTVTGTAVALKAGRRLIAGTAAYVIAGANVLLTYVPAGVAAIGDSFITIFRRRKR